jgi:transcriptional regulator
VIAFSGPHGYVSPTVYGVTPAAPTWNFTAVHVRGTLDPVDGPDETLEVVRSTVHAFERDFGDSWDMTDSLDHFRRILPGVGAFRLRVRSVDSMFKLGQDLNRDLGERVRRSFEDRADGSYAEVAELMGRLAPVEADGRTPGQGRTGGPAAGR